MTDPTAVQLTEAERETLFDAWINNDVTRGIEWLVPAVECIVAARMSQARAEGDALRARVEALADEWLQYAQEAVALGYDQPMMTWASAAQRVRAALSTQPTPDVSAADGRVS